MKAIVVTKLGGPEVLEYQTVERPDLQPHQVLIRVEATGVNYADIKAREGRYHGASQPPFIPGLDAAGIIEEVGSAVTRFHRGQRVIAFPKNGSYAEYIAADEALTFALPDSVDFSSAAACPIVSFTSYKLLADVGRIQPGETVLIHAAAGGIGTTAIQLAKILGAGKVIGSVGHPDKMAVALQAGADHAVCYEEEDFAAKVNEWTNGEGADVILDSIAGRVAERSLDCLAMYGRLVHFGNAGGEAGRFLTKDLHASCRSVLGFSLGTTRNKRPELLQQAGEQVLKFLAEGSLKMMIGKTFPLEDAAKAHEWVESRRSTGKIVLQVR